MKNAILFYFFFIYLEFYSAAQVNLVPNPSFEDTVMCPNSGGQVSLARFWYSIDNTPDYFHSCNSQAQFSVPSNTFGYQFPNTGSAYMGLCDYTTDVPAFREIIGAFLNSPLNIGQRYFVSFHACLAFNPPKEDCNAASNKLGILFSTVDYLSNPPPINNYSQVYAPNIISDTVNWTTIRGTFIADSAYSFISLSNFFDNAHTDTFRLDTTTRVHHCYYYIDDICVSTDSLFSEIWTSLPFQLLKENKIEINPNPARDRVSIINIPIDCKHLEIFDLQGKLIKDVLIDRISNLLLNISSLEAGFYLLVFKMEKSIQVIKINKYDN